MISELDRKRNTGVCHLDNWEKASRKCKQHIQKRISGGKALYLRNLGKSSVAKTQVAVVCQTQGESAKTTWTPVLESGVSSLFSEQLEVISSFKILSFIFFLELQLPDLLSFWFMGKQTLKFHVKWLRVHTSTNLFSTTYQHLVLAYRSNFLQNTLRCSYSYLELNIPEPQYLLNQEYN